MSKVTARFIGGTWDGWCKSIDLCRVYYMPQLNQIKVGSAHPDEVATPIEHNEYNIYPIMSSGFWLAVHSSMSVQEAMIKLWDVYQADPLVKHNIEKLKR